MNIEKACEAFVVFTAVAEVIAFILGAVYAAAWAGVEAKRRTEKGANAELQRACGKARNSTEDSNRMSFPFSNIHVESQGHVKTIPIEVVEDRRQKRDNDLGSAFFGTLVVAAAMVAITVALVADFKSRYIYVDFHTTWDAGFGLFIAALILAVIGFILLAVPQLTYLYMCRRQAIERCQLMLVDVNRPLQDAQASAHAQDLTHTYAELPVALPGLGRHPLRVPSRASSDGNNEAEQRVSPHTPAGYSDVPEPDQNVNYSSATYYTAPPPLFNVLKGCSPK